MTKPIPLSRSHTIGDLVTWRGVNGHKYEGVVSRVYEGRAWSPSINDTWHSDDCGCRTEPWEYEPEGDW